jgi:gliding motility-associated-like protein
MAKFKFSLLLAAILFSIKATSQSATFNSYAFSSGFGCDNGDTLTDNQTPMWNVDLQNDPAAIQLINVDIPSGGYGECCSYANNFSCLVLEILINPLAGGVNFTLAGASGNTYIQYMNCSTTPVQAGTPICISGVGPHYFMFCRTGTTDYSITVESIPAPSGTGDLITTEGCHIGLSVDGLIPSTVTWSSVNPGSPNQYNNLISNVGGGQVGTSGVLYDQDLTDIWVNPITGGPSSITMEVCGEPLINAVCPASAPDQWCTTSTISIYPDLFAVPGPNAIICNGSVTGTVATASAVGGTAPYTYTWTGPGSFSQTHISSNTTDSITVMNPGVYTVVITDATGCPSATTTVNVIEYFVDIIANAGTNVTVCGSPAPSVNLTGSVTATSTGIWSGGNGSYSSNNSDLTLTYIPTAAEISAGSVTLTLTPSNTAGCPFTTDQVIINLTQFNTVLSAVPTNISCIGMTNGSINLTVSPGSPPYAIIGYVWSNGPTTQDLSGLGVGSYSVVVTDANGCSGTISASITQPTQLTSSIVNLSNVSCYGGNDGSVTVAGANATPSYTYTINGSPSQTSGTFSGLVAGSYTVTVTDFNGCTVNQPLTITQPTVVNSSLTPSVYSGGFNISGCTPDGWINLTVSGGTPGYTYSWTNGAIVQDISNLSAGAYSVLITDANGCQTTSSITLTEPSGFSQSISAFTYPSGTNISCNGLSNGSINLTISGGTPGYSYLWNSGQVTQDLTNVPAGIYSVVVTDANGCQIASNITLTEPAPLTESISAFVYPGGANVSCVGMSDGSIALTVGGGNPGYTYAWSTGANTQNISGIPAGSYNVTATDINGCSITSSILLTSPTPVTSTFTPSIYSGGYNLSGCAQDGSINLTVSGGNPGYSYSWSNGQTIEDISNLGVGIYSVTVTDTNGCQTTSNITLTQPNPLAQTISAFTYPSGTNISCFGLSDGAVDLTITGGVPGFTYLWNNGAVSQDLSGVPVGSYNVTITDANGCQIISSITLTEPTPLTASVTAFVYPSGTNISCFGLSDGSIDLTIGGGNSGYTYSWGGSQTTQDVANIPAGTYNVITTDMNGCAIPATISLSQPPALTQSISAFTYPSGTNISCYGLSDGNIDLTVGGGNSGYTYSWSNGQITEDLANVPAGTYNVTITDVNGCTIASTITLTQPSALTQSISAFTYPSGTNISCYGLSDGSVDLTIGGGNPGYTYLWSNGATTQDISGIPFGLNTVTVTDINGCQITSSITLTQPAVLDQTISAFTYPSGTNISCFGLSNGSIDLSISGGSPGYTYAWSGPAIGLAQDLQNVPYGTYNVTATDINGCQINNTITLTQPPLITSSAVLSVYAGGYNLSGCNPDGWIDLNVVGGNPGYSYLWNLPAPASSQSTQDIANLALGIYSVTVTDINGCQTTLDTTLTQPISISTTTQVTSDYNGQDISCMGASDGSVSVTITGGTPVYEIVWLNSAGIVVSTSQSANGLPIDTYTVTIEDQNGCIGNNTISLTEPVELSNMVNVSTDYNGEDISCFGFSDGGINLSVNGGTPGYSFNWTNSSGIGISSLEDPQGLASGEYFVQITDLNGCTTSTSIILADPVPLSATTDVISDYNGQDVSCFGSTDGAVNVTPSGGTPGYNNTWINSGGSTLGTNQNLANVGQGTFYVEVMDLNGCIYSTNVVVNQPTNLTSGITIITNFNGQAVSCVGSEDGRVEANANGGTPGYTYEWNTTPVQTTAQISGLGVGTYTVTVTDANGCISTTAVVLNANPLPTFNLPVSINGCMGAGVMLDSQADPGSSCTWTFSDGQVVNECGPIVVYFSNLDCYDMNLTIMDALGCIDSTSAEDFICIQPNPLAEFHADETDLSNLQGDTYFWNTSEGAETYLWDFGDGSQNDTTFNAYHQFSSDDDFNTVTFPVTLYAITEFGCTDTAVLYINLSPDLIIYVPNAFTPDGDDFNNEFKPVFGTGYSYDNYTFMIFNRWGELVFETQEIGVGWDGTYAGNKVQEGVYTWKLNVKNSVNDSRRELVGHVSLLK